MIRVCEIVNQFRTISCEEQNNTWLLGHVLQISCHEPCFCFSCGVPGFTCSILVVCIMRVSHTGVQLLVYPFFVMPILLQQMIMCVAFRLFCLALNPHGACQCFWLNAAGRGFFFGVYDKKCCWSLGSFQPGDGRTGRLLCRLRVAEAPARSARGLPVSVSPSPVTALESTGGFRVPQNTMATGGRAVVLIRRSASVSLDSSPLGSPADEWSDVDSDPERWWVVVRPGCPASVSKGATRTTTTTTSRKSPGPVAACGSAQVARLRAGGRCAASYLSSSAPTRPAVPCKCKRIAKGLREPAAGNLRDLGRHTDCLCLFQTLLALHLNVWLCRGVNYYKLRIVTFGFALIENGPGSWTVVPCAAVPGGSDRINMNQDFAILSRTWFTCFCIHPSSLAHSYGSQCLKVIQIHHMRQLNHVSIHVGHTPSYPTKEHDYTRRTAARTLTL